jgi:hypothetical protein
VNDRLVTALGALAALVILSALLFQAGQPPQATRPTSVETGPNGYAALARWLEDEGVPVRSLRIRADALRDGALDLPPSGNLLITTMPHRARLRPAESTVLRGWIADGNTLLIVAALDDTPDWSLDVNTAYFLEDLMRLTGLTFGEPEEEDERMRIGNLSRTTTVDLEGVESHPLMDGVARLAGESDSVAAIWQAYSEEDEKDGNHRAVLQLAREQQSGAAALWQVRYGDGHVIVSALGSLLTNRVIGAADNRVLVANLLAYHLGPGGALIFDDMHQGLSMLYDPEAFFGDPRLGATVLFVLGFWVLYLLGSNNRLIAPAGTRAAPSQGDFVTGVGGFLARKLSRAEAGRLMVGAWFDELRRRGAIPAGDGPPWQALAAMSALEAQQLARLCAYHAALEGGAAVDLTALHNTIEELRRMLR